MKDNKIPNKNEIMLRVKEIFLQIFRIRGEDIHSLAPPLFDTVGD